MQTKICFIRRNFENLQNLFNNLDHSFSVISVSKAWTPESKSKQFNPKTYETYYKHYGIKGKLLKSGNGFYIWEDTKFKQPNDLNLSFCDESYKFHYCWIKILDEKIQLFYWSLL